VELPAQWSAWVWHYAQSGASNTITQPDTTPGNRLTKEALLHQSVLSSTLDQYAYATLADANACERSARKSLGTCFIEGPPCEFCADAEKLCAGPSENKIDRRFSREILFFGDRHRRDLVLRSFHVTVPVQTSNPVEKRIRVMKGRE
jgi:hypothetical protein